MDQDIVFDFEHALRDDQIAQGLKRPVLPTGEIGQQPKNFVKNFKKTVCAFWIKGMCMKGDNCGFLHEMIPERMPECNNFLKRGVCNDQDCPFKHSKDGILECNMYALGFCIYGPECRYKHTRRPGPPPPAELVEAAKPKTFRDINRVVNSVNKNVVADVAHKRPRMNNFAHRPPAQLQGPRPPSAPAGPAPPGARPQFQGAAGPGRGGPPAGAPPMRPPGAPPMPPRGGFQSQAGVNRAFAPGHLPGNPGGMMQPGGAPNPGMGAGMGMGMGQNMRPGMGPGVGPNMGPGMPNLGPGMGPGGPPQPGRGGRVDFRAY